LTPFSLRDGQHGQGLVEYSMVLVIVGLVLVAMLVTTGHQVTKLFSNITATLHQAGL